MLTEKDFPTTNDILPFLLDLPARVEPEMKEGEDDTPSIDVRLQVEEDGSWSIHTGSAQYDTDHSGFWGSGSVLATDGEAQLRGLADSLICQAQEDAWQADAMEEDIPARDQSPAAERTQLLADRASDLIVHRNALRGGLPD